ncbi:Flp pilus assembly pilin Flp [Youngiibacter multivorans]|uniref:Flp pilus assembly pilin Flp n=1 Tax=Youngiibacter multivorans TaxID=937251 RepID=A0ABS4G8B4_9CLOT|nr:Flp pilus assembly pilin Flp [Youngiibacter multivorans]
MILKLVYNEDGQSLVETGLLYVFISISAVLVLLSMKTAVFENFTHILSTITKYFN